MTRKDFVAIVNDMQEEFMDSVVRAGVSYDDLIAGITENLDMLGEAIRAAVTPVGMEEAKKRVCEKRIKSLRKQLRKKHAINLMCIDRAMLQGRDWQTDMRAGEVRTVWLASDIRDNGDLVAMDRVIAAITPIFFCESISKVFADVNPLPEDPVEEEPIEDVPETAVIIKKEEPEPQKDDKAEVEKKVAEKKAEETKAAIGAAVNNSIRPETATIYPTAHSRGKISMIAEANPNVLTTTVREPITTTQPKAPENTTPADATTQTITIRSTGRRRR